MKNVDTDLLFFLSERGEHAFDSEAAALLFFTERNDIEKDQLLKLFKSIEWVFLKLFLKRSINHFSFSLDHNKDRDKGKYDWEAVKPKVLTHLSKTLEYPNASFATNIEEMHLRKTDFLVAMNPTVSNTRK